MVSRHLVLGIVNEVDTFEDILLDKSIDFSHALTVLGVAVIDGNRLLHLADVWDAHIAGTQCLVLICFGKDVHEYEMEISAEQVCLTPRVSQVAVVSRVFTHLAHSLDSVVGYGYALII